MTTTFTPTPDEAQQFAILGADPEHTAGVRSACAGSLQAGL